MKQKYNLTDTQKQIARSMVAALRSGDLSETFAFFDAGDGIEFVTDQEKAIALAGPRIQPQQLRALELAGLLFIPEEGQGTVLGSIFKAVDSNFGEADELLPVSTFAHGIPPELNASLNRLRGRYPDPSKTGFLIMRFTPGKPFDGIVKAIQETGDDLGLSILRADQNEFHADLWGNVRTHLEACSFGIAVYERIDQDEPNANVGLEVGYLLAQNKPVLLLKEKTVKNLQADLMGKLYKQFDEHDPQGTIPDQLRAWLKDYGIVL